MACWKIPYLWLIFPAFPAGSLHLVRVFPSQPRWHRRVYSIIIPLSSHYYPIIILVLAPCELILEHCNLEKCTMYCKKSESKMRRKNARTKHNAKKHAYHKCKKNAGAKTQFAFFRIFHAFHLVFATFFPKSCLSSWSLVWLAVFFAFS